MGNILFTPIPMDDRFIKYTIDKKDYYIPNYGFIVTLWDFGYAFIPGKLMRGDSMEYYTDLQPYNIKNVTKIIPDWVQIPRLNVDYNRITSQISMFLKKNIPVKSRVCDVIIHKFNKGENLKDIIQSFTVFQKKTKKILYSCSLDKKLDISKIEKGIEFYLTAYAVGISKSPDFIGEIDDTPYFIESRNSFLKDKSKKISKNVYEPENYFFTTGFSDKKVKKNKVGKIIKKIKGLSKEKLFNKSDKNIGQHTVYL
jgi:hypothetical protein